MKVVEAQDIINSLYKQITQKTDITAVDNTSLVDMGKTLQTGAYSREEIYNTIIDKVGQTVLRNRLFAVKFPKIFRSEQEFGSILETLRFKRVPAEKSEIYNTKAGNYQQDDYTPMEVEAKYFTDYADYRYSFWKPMGDQLWSAFKSLDAMTNFLSGIEITIENSFRMDAMNLAKNVLNTKAAYTLNKEFPAGNFGADSKNMAINVWHLYKAIHPTETRTLAEMTYDKDYLAFKVFTILNTITRMEDVSSAFNIDGQDEQTKPEELGMVLLDTQDNLFKTHLYANTYNAQFLQLPNYDTVSSFQATGTDYGQDVISEITQIINGSDGQPKTITLKGIIGYIYDIRGVAINCERKSTRSHYNARIDQTRFYMDWFGQSISDPSINFAVLYEAEAE